MTPTEQQVEAVARALWRVKFHQRFHAADRLIPMISAALSATPAQVSEGEPVAWIYEKPGFNAQIDLRQREPCPGWTELPLYAHPAPAAAAPAEDGEVERLPICIGRHSIEKLAQESLVTFEDGSSLIAASDLYELNPYARAEGAEARIAEAVAAEREAIAAMLDAEAAELSVYRDHWPQRDELRKMAERIRARSAPLTSEEETR